MCDLRGDSLFCRGATEKLAPPPLIGGIKAGRSEAASVFGLVIVFHVRARTPVGERMRVAPSIQGRPRHIGDVMNRLPQIDCEVLAASGSPFPDHRSRRCGSHIRNSIGRAEPDPALHNRVFAEEADRAAGIRRIEPDAFHEFVEVIANVEVNGGCHGPAPATILVFKRHTAPFNALRSATIGPQPRRPKLRLPRRKKKLASFLTDIYMTKAQARVHSAAKFSFRPSYRNGFDLDQSVLDQSVRYSVALLASRAASRHAFGMFLVTAADASRTIFEQEGELSALSRSGACSPASPTTPRRGSAPRPSPCGRRYPYRR